MEFLREQFQHPPVGLVPLVQEVDDHYIVLLTVPVTSADTLLDTLRIPRQVVVDDQGAELQVNTLRGRLRGDHDRRVIPEVPDERGSHVHRPGASDTSGSRVPLCPFLIDAGGLRAVVAAVEVPSGLPPALGLFGAQFIH